MSNTSKVKILVVDDRKENLLAMDKLLKPLGAEVRKVDSGEAALSEVLNHQFAVILLDVQMPGMDGFECATLLHSNKQTANIPIIFVTAINKDQAYVNKGYKAGAVDYLPKPIVPEILLGKVRVFLQLEQQRLELEDVTRQLRWISRKNKLLLDCASEGIVGLDNDGKVSFINPAACSLLGGTEESLLEKHISQFMYASDDDPMTSWDSSGMKENCLQNGGNFQMPSDLWRQSVGSFPAELNAAALVNEKNQVQGAVLVFNDITERKKLEDQLTKMAKYDNLTGLANRALFKEFLQMSLARSERRQKNTGVMYLDLDHFKEVNDTLGHDAGDALLVSVANRLQECVRDGDMVARLGGDEFAIVLDDVAEPQDARTIAEKILEQFALPHDLSGEMRKVGTSIGIATSCHSGDDPDALIKAADDAMYTAKKAGRNGYRMAHELRE
ncbi:diguanylate cyclase [Endozoicomonas gorgoniicola]|uniref:Diguanylate cyclase n=1 Tax=Endozoicomonas gorgoniicola TaxID=1234144 RepID=A0ABT3MYM9_9GAMM|nr:diguanylate cyclase [Endozoicomonas gorgoniicola]MCW7554475.1 diguanylate cyclase [Endozoicomonas gorgoniicola]